MKITAFDEEHSYRIGVGGTLDLTSTSPADSTVVQLENQDGADRSAGDVVLIDTANDEAFVTTTTAAVTSAVGVLLEDIADGEIGSVVVSGFAPLVNTNGVSVTRGEYLATSTTAAAADHLAARAAGTFGQYLDDGTTPSAVIWAPDLGGGSSGGTGAIKAYTANVGGPLAPGVAVFAIELPWAGEITGWVVVADRSGSVTIGIWKSDFGGFPPDASGSICGEGSGGIRPFLSGSIIGSGSDLTNWTPTFAAGDILRINLDSIDGVIERVELTMTYTRA